MGGGGGFVGTVQNGAWESVNRGYATVGTDTGHQEPSGISARWALNDVEAQLNFGYLAVHRTAEAAKAIVRSYYGSDAAYNYFTGCSRGGGQAMMEAQRYPKDFDGLVAGAPAFDWTGMAAAAASVAKVIYPDPAHVDKTVLDRASLQKLQQAILEQGDAQDGLKDGIIQDLNSGYIESSLSELQLGIITGSVPYDYAISFMVGGNNLNTSDDLASNDPTGEYAASRVRECLLHGRWKLTADKNQFQGDGNQNSFGVFLRFAFFYNALV